MTVKAGKVNLLQQAQDAILTFGSKKRRIAFPSSFTETPGTSRPTEKRRPGRPKGKTLQLDAYVVRVPHAADYENAGVIHPLLRLHADDYADDSVFEPPAAKAVLWYKWKTWGFKYFLAEFVHYLLWFITFTTFAGLRQAEDVSQSLSQIVKSPSGRGTIAMEVVSFVLMLPFLYKEVMLVVHYKEDWFHLSNDFHLWGEVLQVVIFIMHFSRAGADSVVMPIFCLLEVILIFLRAKYFIKPTKLMKRPMVNYFVNMISEAKYFFFILIILVIVFSKILNSLMWNEGGPEQPFATFGRSLGTCFAAVLDLDTLDAMRSKSHPVAAPVVVVLFTFVIKIIVFNCIVALMTGAVVTATSGEIEAKPTMIYKARVTDQFEIAMPRWWKERNRAHWYPKYVHYIQVGVKRHNLLEEAPAPQFSKDDSPENDGEGSVDERQESIREPTNKGQRPSDFDGSKSHQVSGEGLDQGKFGNATPNDASQQASEDWQQNEASETQLDSFGLDGQSPCFECEYELEHVEDESFDKQIGDEEDLDTKGGADKFQNAQSEEARLFNKNAQSPQELASLPLKSNFGSSSVQSASPYTGATCEIIPGLPEKEGNFKIEPVSALSQVSPKTALQSDLPKNANVASSIKSPFASQKGLPDTSSKKQFIKPKLENNGIDPEPVLERKDTVITQHEHKAELNKWDSSQVALTMSESGLAALSMPYPGINKERGPKLTQSTDARLERKTSSMETQGTFRNRGYSSRESLEQGSCKPSVEALVEAIDEVIKQVEDLDEPNEGEPDSDFTAGKSEPQGKNAVIAIEQEEKGSKATIDNDIQDKITPKVAIPEENDLPSVVSESASDSLLSSEELQKQDQDGASKKKEAKSEGNVSHIIDSRSSESNSKEDFGQKLSKSSYNGLEKGSSNDLLPSNQKSQVKSNKNGRHEHICEFC